MIKYTLVSVQFPHLVEEKYEICWLSESPHHGSWYITDTSCLLTVKRSEKVRNL